MGDDSSGENVTFPSRASLQVRAKNAGKLARRIRVAIQRLEQGKRGEGGHPSRPLFAPGHAVSLPRRPVRFGRGAEPCGRCA